MTPTNPPQIVKIPSNDDDDIPEPHMPFDDYVIDQTARKLTQRCLDFYTNTKNFLRSLATKTPQTPSNDCEFDIWQAVHFQSYKQTRDNICAMFSNPKLIQMVDGPQKTLKVYHSMALFFLEGVRQNKEYLAGLMDIDKAGIRELDIYGGFLALDKEALEWSEEMEGRMLRVERGLTEAMIKLFEQSAEECIGFMKTMQLDLVCVELWSEWASGAVEKKRRKRTRKGKGVVLRKGW
jgi:hypothetical protein